MFPLKTLVLAAILAVAFGPSLMACPAHNHMQMTKAPAAEETATSASSASSQPAQEATKEAKPADVAAAPATTPAAN